MSNVSVVRVLSGWQYQSDEGELSCFCIGLPDSRDGRACGRNAQFRGGHAAGSR